MKKIKTSRGKFALVDDQDYESLAKLKWTCSTSKSGVHYAQTAIYYPDEKRQTTVAMARMIMAVTDPGLFCDHKDGNGLNNQRANLRLVTKRKNNYGFRRKIRGASSRFRGVSWDRSGNGWRAMINLSDGDRRIPHYLGVFETEEAAAHAFNAKAIELGFFPEALNVVEPKACKTG